MIDGIDEDRFQSPNHDKKLRELTGKKVDKNAHGTKKSKKWMDLK